MLEKLSPKEFEDWCQVLLERHYGCKVENTPYTGDEGRDLIVHHPSGKILVECKHSPNRTIGRPVVQKLDSAIRKAHAHKGMIITTGRFSKTARQYAEELELVEIEFVDSAKLSYMAEKVGLSPTSSHIDKKTSLAVRTIPDTDFPEVFLASIFSEPRFNPGDGNSLDDYRISRETTYKGFFVTNFSADGELETAAGTFSASWAGTVWTTLDGSTCGTPNFDLSKLQLIPLGQALKHSPGPSSPPRIQPHQALTIMKDYLVRTCSKTIRYTGRNNVTYIRDVKPKAQSVHMSNVRLIYFPEQRFTLYTNEVTHTGKIREKDNRFIVQSQTLRMCCVCGRATTAKSQILCAVCHRPAHRWSFSTPGSFRCSRCGAIACRVHTYRDGREKVCTRCSTGSERPLGKRWLPHLAFGIALSFLFVAVVAVALIGLSRILRYNLQPHNVLELLIIVIGLLLGFVGLLFGWRPFLYVANLWRPNEKRCLLSYPIKLAPDSDE